jgi:hypothetical protein
MALIYSIVIIALFFWGLVFIDSKKPTSKYDIISDEFISDSNYNFETIKKTLCCQWNSFREKLICLYHNLIKKIVLYMLSIADNGQNDNTIIRVKNIALTTQFTPIITKKFGSILINVYADGKPYATINAGKVSATTAPNINYLLKSTSDNGLITISWDSNMDIQAKVSDIAKQGTYTITWI